VSGQVVHCWEKAGSYDHTVVVGCNLKNVGKSSAQKVQNHIVYLTRP
jgi:hypothetical protein